MQHILSPKITKTQKALVFFLIRQRKLCFTWHLSYQVLYISSFKVSSAKSTDTKR